ncbi:MAG: hypothetical protein P8X63_15260 [Desulfuromonadaceae bacterium]
MRDAETDGQLEILAGPFEAQFTDILAQSFRYPHGLVEAGFRQHQGKLLPAETGGEIVIPQLSFHGLGQSLQDHIPLLMAVTVVDLFEMVDIDHDQGQWFLGALATLQFLVQGFHQKAPVAQLGQGIGVGEIQQGLVAFFQTVLEILDFELDLDPGKHLPRIEGFGQVVAGAQFQTTDFGFLILHPGDHDDRDVLELLAGFDHAQKLETVHARHVQVAEDDVQRETQGDFEGVHDAVGFVVGLKKVDRLETVHNLPTGSCRIINDQNGRFHVSDLNSLRRDVAC